MCLVVVELKEVKSFAWLINHVLPVFLLLQHPYRWTIFNSGNKCNALAAVRKLTLHSLIRRKKTPQFIPFQSLLASKLISRKGPLGGKICHGTFN